MNWSLPGANIRAASLYAVFVLLTSQILAVLPSTGEYPWISKVYACFDDDACYIFVNTDKASYKVAETVVVSGEVEMNNNQPVQVRILSPNGQTFRSDFVAYNPDSSYSYQFVIRGASAINGKYTVEVTHGGEVATTQFDYSNKVLALSMSQSNIVYGSATVLNAQLQHNYQNGGTVQFEWSTDSTIWNPISSMPITYGAPKTQSWQPQSGGSYLVRALLILSNPSGTGYSNILNLSVAAAPTEVSLSSSALNAELGESLTLQANADATLSGSIAFQHSTDQAQWETIETISISNQDQASINWHPDATGLYFVRALYGGDPSHQPAQSGVIQVDITQDPANLKLELDVSPLVASVSEAIDLVVVADSGGVVSQNAIFQYSTDQATWLELGQRPFDSDGEAHFVWTPNTSGIFHIRALYPGDSTFTAAQSNAVEIRVEDQQLDQNRLVLSVDRTRALQGDEILLQLYTHPAAAGNVIFQFSSDNESWKDLEDGSVTLDNNGMAAMYWIADSLGTVYLRGFYPGNSETYPQAVSDVVRIEVSQAEEGPPHKAMSVEMDRRTVTAGEQAELWISYSVNTPIDVEITNPNGMLVAAASIATGADGKAQFSFDSTSEHMIGDYVVLVIDPAPDGGSNSTGFSVIDGNPDPRFDPAIRLQAEPPLRQSFVSGEVLITLNNGISVNDPQLENLLQDLGASIVEVVPEINLIRLSVPQGAEQSVSREILSNDNDELVAFAGVNRYIVPTSTLSQPADESTPAIVADPDFSKQARNYKLINLPEAWNATLGVDRVIVAVIDSGIQIEHPDLAGNIWFNTDDDCSDGIDNDSNGFVDDCRGWNFSGAHAGGNNNDVSDEVGSWPQCNGHGTHVAGIVAALSNTIGGLGVAPNITIMTVKVSGNEDVEGALMCISTEFRVVQAIIYASDNGADVMNLSFGCGGGLKCERYANSPFEMAFAYASDRGALLVAAAGNERESSEGIDDWQDYTEYLVQVSSVGTDGTLASYSNFGSGVDISAPGTAVYSTKAGNIYGIKSGTSQATPMVSGCAAIVLSVNQTLVNTEVERILTLSAKDIGDDGKDAYYGYGLLDCGNAINNISMATGKEKDPSATATPASSVDNTSSPIFEPVIPSESDGQSTSQGGGGCLIATAAFGSELAPQVQFLRTFRDNHVLSTTSGTAFMNVFNSWYYSFSPQVAQYERDQPWLQAVVRIGIYPLLFMLQASEIAFYASPGEFGSILAGAVSASLIGATYFLPAGVWISRHARTTLDNIRTVGLLMFSLSALSCIALIICLNLPSETGLMVTTSAFILTVLITASTCAGYLVSRFVSRIRILVQGQV